MHWAERQDALQQWTATAEGRKYAVAVRKRLREMLPGVFGYIGVQVGEPMAEVDLLSHSGLLKHICVGHSASGQSNLVADPHHLPLATGKANCVLLANVLDCAEDPHQVLREADRILQPDGQLIIIGFNPFSWHGLKRSLPFLSRKMPDLGPMIPSAQVIDWLGLLNFESEKRVTSHTGKRTESHSNRWWQRWANPLADGYIIRAKKRTHMITPITAMPNSRSKVIHAVFVGAQRGHKREEKR